MDRLAAMTTFVRIVEKGSLTAAADTLDTSLPTVVRTLAAGFEPNAVWADPSARTVYTANRISNDISVIDASTGAVKRRLAAGRGAGGFRSLFQPSSLTIPGSDEQ